MNYTNEEKYKRNNNIERLSINFLPNKKGQPGKLLEQTAFNTRPKIEEHVLIVMKKSIHEAHLSQPLQTNNKQFKIAVTFLTGYNGIFNVTDKNDKFYFTKSITDDDGFIQLTTPAGAYELEILNIQIKRVIFNE